MSNCHDLKDVKFDLDIWPFIAWGSGGHQRCFAWDSLADLSMAAILQSDPVRMEPTTSRSRGGHYTTRQLNHSRFLTCDINLDIEAAVLSHSHCWPLSDHATLDGLGHDSLSGSGWFCVGLTWIIVTSLVTAWWLHNRHSQEVLDQLEPLED